MKSKIQVILILYFIVYISNLTQAQISINADGASPDASAILDISSTDKGFLSPRMTTTEREAISSPATGLLVYDTDENSFWYYANATWINLSSAILADTDADTKIQVEENSDEDIIRFDMNGTEFLKLNNGRIEPLNTGSSIFIGENAGNNDDFSDNNNILIGTNAGQLNTTGAYNILLGGDAGVNNTTGKNNVFLGYKTGYSNETGSNNIFLGYEAGYSETGSNKLYIENSNSSSPLIYGAFDNDSLQINGKLNINGNYNFPTTDGDTNQFLMTNGEGNTFWTKKLTILTDADKDTKIQMEKNDDEDIIRFDVEGKEWMKLIDGRLEFDNLGSSIFIGQGTGMNDDYTDNKNVFIGDSIGANNTTGECNNFIGAAAGWNNTTGNKNTFTGYAAGGYNSTGSYNTFIGQAAAIYDSTGNYNTFIGQAVSPYSTSSLYNTCIGFRTGFSSETGENNTFVGHMAGYSNTTGSFNTFINTTAGYSNTTGENNLFIGYQAGIDNTTGSYNLSLGNNAGHSNKNDGNVFLGFNAGYSESGSNTLYIGSNTNSHLIYGEFDNDYLEINGALNISDKYNLPTSDGSINQILITDGNATISWADLYPNLISNTDSTTIIKAEANSDDDTIRFELAGTEFMRLDSGQIEIINTGSSIFIGEQAGINDDYTDNRNIFLGYQAGYENATGNRNIVTGYKAGLSISTTSNNIFTGSQTGLNTLTGDNNIFTGTQTGLINSTGAQNIFIGYFAGKNNSSGFANIFLGTKAGKNNESGHYNISLGHQAGVSNTSGAKNIYIGQQTGKNALDSDELYIDNSSVDYPLIYGDFEDDIVELNGSVGIGTTPTNAKFEVLGNGDALASYTYGYLNSSGTTGLWTNAPVYSIYADGKIAGFSFHAHSDERIKNIKGLSNNQADLKTLMNIQITDYTLKDTIGRGLNPIKKVIAQQVAEVYPNAVSKNTTQVIPDIFQTATIGENGWIDLATDLNVGEKVQIIFNNKKELLEVLEVTKNAFRVNKSEIVNPNFSHEARPSKSEIIFIYGRQVTDFHTVDYEAVSMLNVSVTQQLAKENKSLKQQIIDLEQRVEKVKALENKNKQLQSQLKKIDELEAKFEALLNQ